MSTWEERMSQRAKARIATEQKVADEDFAVRLARIVKELPALPGEHRNEYEVTYGGRDDHLGHLTHWCGGGTFRCSCGAIAGVTAYIPTEGDSKPCETCKARKIGEFAEVVGPDDDLA